MSATLHTHTKNRVRKKLQPRESAHQQTPTLVHCLLSCRAVLSLRFAPEGDQALNPACAWVSEASAMSGAAETGVLQGPLKTLRFPPRFANAVAEAAVARLVLFDEGSIPKMIQTPVASAAMAFLGTFRAIQLSDLLVFAARYPGRRDLIKALAAGVALSRGTGGPSPLPMRATSVALRLRAPSGLPCVAEGVTAQVQRAACVAALSGPSFQLHMMCTR